MDLFYILLNHQDFPAQQLIYAETPWTLQSRVIMLDPISSPLPILHREHTEYRFFLELASVARIMQLYSARNLCLADQCQSIIELALKARQDDCC